jgi:hypothetical protein
MIEIVVSMFVGAGLMSFGALVWLYNPAGIPSARVVLQDIRALPTVVAMFRERDSAIERLVDQARERLTHPARVFRKDR